MWVHGKYFAATAEYSYAVNIVLVHNRNLTEYRNIPRQSFNYQRSKILFPHDSVLKNSSFPFPSFWFGRTFREHVFLVIILESRASEIFSGLVPGLISSWTVIYRVSNFKGIIPPAPSPAPALAPFFFKKIKERNIPLMRQFKRGRNIPRLFFFQSNNFSLLYGEHWFLKKRIV